jgi:hypothetical protein
VPAKIAAQLTAEAVDSATTGAEREYVSCVKVDMPMLRSEQVAPCIETNIRRPVLDLPDPMRARRVRARSMRSPTRRLILSSKSAQSVCRAT